MVVIPTATALPTAEGAVQVAMEELPLTLHSARVLILGFGRVGKLTAHRMGALGAKVTPDDPEPSREIDIVANYHVSQILRLRHKLKDQLADRRR